MTRSKRDGILKRDKELDARRRGGEGKGGSKGELGLQEGGKGKQAATYSAVVAKEAQGGGRLQWEGQDLLEVQRGLHDGGLPEQREGPCPAQAA